MALSQSDYASFSDYLAANRAQASAKLTTTTPTTTTTPVATTTPTSTTATTPATTTPAVTTPSTSTTPSSTSTTSTTDSSVIRDLPTPTIGSDTEDDMFLTSIQNLTLSELTPEQITKLIDIQQSRAETQATTDLGGYYNPQITTANTNIDRLTQELADTTTSEATRVQDEIDRSFGLVDTKYAPEFSRIQASGDAAVEDTQRSYSFNGAGRGNRAEDARQEIITSTNEITAAKEAEVALEKSLVQAQIEGASKATLDALSAQLDAAKTARSTLEADFAKATADLNATLATAGQGSVQSFLDTLTTQAAMAAYDPTLSSSMGQIVDSRGNPILGADGKALQPAMLPVEANAEISKQLGYLADASGNAITDTDGKVISVNKGVKSTFQDGAKNTYILFEDGSVQQIGSTSSSGSGGSGSGSSAGGGYDDSLTPIYDIILQYASENDVNVAEAVDALNLSSNSAVDRENYITGATNYYTTLVANQPATTPSSTVKYPSTSLASQLVNAPLSQTLSSFGQDVAAAPSSIWNWFTGQK